MLKVVFLGTPQFAVPSLTAVAANFNLVGVVCQRDKPGNRGVVTECAVKTAARAFGVPVLQFDKISSEEGLAAVRALAPDVMVTAAFGQILSNAFLEIAPHGVLNVHASLLPKYRGAAPINFALLAGEQKTGVTIVKTVYELDAGDMLLAAETDITPTDNAGTLSARLSALGADLIVKALRMVESGTARYTPQDHAKATKCGKITPQIRLINWNEGAETVHNRVRALAPNIGAHTFLDGKRVIIHESICHSEPFVGEESRPSVPTPGSVLASADSLLVSCGGGTALSVLKLQLEGGKPLTAEQFLRGNAQKLGANAVFADE